MHKECLINTQDNNISMDICVIIFDIFLSSSFSAQTEFFLSRRLCNIQIFIFSMCTMLTQFPYLFSALINPVPEFAQLCARLLNPYWPYYWEIIASIFSMLAVLGAAIVYWVLMSNFLYTSVDYCIGK